MTYTHLTPTELVMIEAYYTEKVSVARIAHSLGRARQTIYNVINYLVEGHSVSDYYNQYKENKRRYGRRAIVLPQDQQTYIRKMVAENWTPDVIIGRKEIRINCSMRTLYRQFKQGMFDIKELPMKRKRHPNGHQEKRGKQALRRNLRVELPTILTITKSLDI